MATFRVCGVQMPVGPGKKENLPRILEYIEECDCDFILFPEMALTGYNNDFSEARTAEAWRQIGAACRQAYVSAIVGTGARQEGHTYIQSRIYRDDGELLGTHEKIVPTQEERKWCRPGGELRAFRHMGLNFGCLICNDLWVSPGNGPYPDARLSLQLGQQGCQLIFHSINSGTDARYAQYHDANLRLRALESKIYIVTANAAHPHQPVNAPSGIVGPDGEWLVQCPLSGEHSFTYDLEIDIE
ncbi:MAG: carbon-nitrogen hydrolase family protein [Candidatus Hydrogenedentes bacterium]|nr:carbon-nitrogen hydrolase family protein [Candidatus Hydrogenedentota bacterium]MBI3119503.1 carbon-nitrogen hydrolase family protein [Candidatus Hydrogenedentota bacterium]